MSENLKKHEWVKVGWKQGQFITKNVAKEIIAEYYDQHCCNTCQI